ncbi:hypothetical protein [uncultured Sulfitobacter sp.]|uniref:hypothetical protein n=1 Tax=uncultured Sulfitobacter sp. TaxID=191468 RepID=UPI00260C89C8|nr:hypothetical protein [uncultured Sulfitobacter sp.]
MVEIKYRQQQESFARLMVQENRLRASLTQLDQQMADSRASKDSPQKAIGADVLWQAWIGRKKRELNMQLAQILAVKERHIAQVRHAYGKVLVTQTLVDETHTKARQKMAQSLLDRAISSMLF